MVSDKERHEFVTICSDGPFETRICRHHRKTKKKGKRAAKDEGKKQKGRERASEKEDTATVRIYCNDAFDPA